MNVLLIFFLLVIPFYLQLWLLGAKEELSELQNPLQPISVVIPFRNEFANLANLQNCIDQLELIQGDEIILVDDQSNDQGAKLLSSLREECTLVSIPQGKTGSKKNALRIGIKLAKNDWILTSDADCTLLPQWLNAWRKEIHDNRDFIVGRVALTSSATSMLDLFISAEHLTLQTLTKGSIKRNVPIMCSGANLVFRKSIWEQTGSYSNHLDISSGDDVLFMKDVAKAEGRIAYAGNIETVVCTPSAATFKSWLQQRLRWMSKSSHIDGFNSRFHAILLLIWLFSFPVGLFFFQWLYLLFLIPEYLILRISSPVKISLSEYLFWPFFRFFYPFVTIFLFIASFFVKVKWKDRAIAAEA